jgi:hypothetical protein
MRKGATTPSRNRQDVKLKRSKNELGEHVKKLNVMLDERIILEEPTTKCPHRMT